jgi:diguanylate cyclase (GGDEF)-like protein
MENPDDRFTDGLWALLNETFECILLAEPDPWRVKYANFSAAQRFEALPQALVGRKIETLFVDSSKDDVICRLNETLPALCGPWRPVYALLQTPSHYVDVAQIKCVRLTIDGVAMVGMLLDDTIYPKMDSLTPLRDRDYLFARLLRLFAHPAAHFAILFIDLDGFKKVNDSHGHLVGDQVLYEAAVRIRHCAEPANPVTRYGGDEFIVLVEDAFTVEEVEDLAKRIREAIAPPISVPDGEVHLSASIGVAVRSPEYRTPNDLIAAADRAMYAAKRRL